MVSVQDVSTTAEGTRIIRNNFMELTSPVTTESDENRRAKRTAAQTDHDNGCYEDHSGGGMYFPVRKQKNNKRRMKEDAWIERFSEDFIRDVYVFWHEVIARNGGDERFNAIRYRSRRIKSLFLHLLK